MQQRLRRTVHQADAALAVDRDDSGGDRFEHGFDEGAAHFELRIGTDERLRLRLELCGHPVERAGKQADLIGAAASLDTHSEVAAADIARRRDKLDQRSDLPVSETQRDPDGERDQRE